MFTLRIFHYRATKIKHNILSTYRNADNTDYQEIRYQYRFINILYTKSMSVITYYYIWSTQY